MIVTVIDADNNRQNVRTVLRCARRSRLSQQTHVRPRALSGGPAVVGVR